MVKNALLKRLAKAIYSPLLETTIDGAGSSSPTLLVVLTLIEAEASEIVNQAAGQSVNIWLGIIDEMDESSIFIVATGVRQSAWKK